jgi:hypothetical protein
MAEDAQLKELRDGMTKMQVEMVTRADLQEAMKQSQTEMIKHIQELLTINNRNVGQQEPNANHGISFSGIGNSYHEGNSSGDGFHTKSIRLEFPRFDGEDPESWCCRATQFFEFYSTPDAQRLTISSFHMEGKALVWFQELRATKCVSNWEEFVRAVQIRFGKGSYDDPMETLTKLKQVGLLEDYKTQFENLAIKVHGLPETHKLSCFLGGLKDEIRLPVRMFNPKSLVDAYSLARIQEEYVLNSRRNARSFWSPSQAQNPSHGMSAELPVGFPKVNGFGSPRMHAQGPSRHYPQVPMGVGQNKGSSTNPNQAMVPIQKISQAQMEERRRKGLCYSCDSKWSRGHVCQVPKLFLIEALEDGNEVKSGDIPPEEDDPGEFFLEEFPEISLNAITGSPSPKTMRIVGILKYHQVVILIDSGSTP